MYHYNTRYLLGIFFSGLAYAIFTDKYWVAQHEQFLAGK